jgi:3-(3-hydroxy-phenyl)propionate hydroxylase
MHHERPRFGYRRYPEQDAPGQAARPVVIVGAGPVGLSMGIELAARGVPVTILDDDDTVSEGSRAIAYAKRTLEIWTRLGVGDRIRDKGVSWKVSKVFHKNSLLYEFTTQLNDSQEMPAFVNLQQYHVEELLIERCAELGVDIRWRHRLAGVRRQRDDGPVTLDIETPDGPYRLGCDWLVAADGARSQVRKSLGLTFKGRVFDERFLIMDIKMLSDYPAERWFWFDPPFNPNKSALLHMQADNIWRVGNQLGIGLGDDFDEEAEKSPDRVMARLRAMLGADLEFEIDWVSVFTFQCRRLEDFVHGRVIFVGDAAHQVSPFGGRGANSGVQDAENLAWKLDLVLRGKAPVGLLGSYSAERGEAADENILSSTRTTDFVTPKTRTAEIFRDAVLTLAREHAFARELVNSGRLSVASVYQGSALDTPDADLFAPRSVAPGHSALDAPLTRADGTQTWLMRELPGEFTLICYGPPDLAGLAEDAAVRTLSIAPAGTDGGLVDQAGVFARLYDAKPGTAYLLRPDRYLCGRWRSADRLAITQAIDRASARTLVGRS